jgi:hypothetical protein
MPIGVNPAPSDFRSAPKYVVGNVPNGDSASASDWTLVYQASRTSIATPTHFALACNPYARPAIARLVSYVASVP